ncbi:uncharacterized protein LOC129350847 [Amphiprion ocellaris]|uniref:uncharacterized protein LOC129350847 n=1 Tax=Amphiprion ocellaris TaxID=80972 RepID=UPI002410CE92|nr:uncharacterized protein LOC129350847 [Amphiprion ocellaris]
MASALLRGRALVCVRCLHRELCRVVWKPQSALFSSKPSDRKQPRRTHIKKAKPQPPIDIAKLLETLFSQTRPGTAPPAAATAQHAKISSTSTKPHTTSMRDSTSNVPPSSKPGPSVFPSPSSFKQAVPNKTTFNIAELFPQPKSAVNPKTLFSSESCPQPNLNVVQASVAEGLSLEALVRNLESETLTETTGYLEKEAENSAGDGKDGSEHDKADVVAIFETNK